MNIIINYDLVEYLKNSNQELNPFKLMRSLKHNKVFIAYNTFWVVKNLSDYPLGKALGVSLFSFGSSVTIAFMYFSAKKNDPLKVESDEALKKLCYSLKDININTDFDLLKKSRVDGKIYNFKLNEKKIPQIIESKYILVPSYDNNGDIKDTSIVQEHAMFSSEYILSRGSMEKKKVLVYSNM